MDTWDTWADTPLKLSPIASRQWRLCRDYVVRVPDGPTIRVPKGFECDLSSVPRPLWWYAPQHGAYTPAALVHDWLYYSGIMTRQQADDLFYRHMLACGVRRSQAWVKYRAVRMFGGSAWRRHRRRDYV